MSDEAPVVFVSYSHDSEAHKAWVLQLSNRLMRNGVDIILDQWDVRLGGNIGLFMEQGLTKARRVLVICTDAYVDKANEGKSGVGFEKTILTQHLMQDSNTDLIIPIIINNARKMRLPTFLSARKYIDFSISSDYEKNYTELLYDLHGQLIQPRPLLGPNPFEAKPHKIVPAISFSHERYISPAMAGEASFDFSNNNGRYVVGAGEMAFETRWTKAGANSIHAYNEGSGIQSLAIAWDCLEIENVIDASQFDGSSRVRTPQVGNVVVWLNTAGYWMALKILSIKLRDGGAQHDELTFRYRIAPAKANSFAG